MKFSSTKNTVLCILIDSTLITGGTLLGVRVASFFEKKGIKTAIFIMEGEGELKKTIDNSGIEHFYSKTPDIAALKYCKDRNNCIIWVQNYRYFLTCEIYVKKCHLNCRTIMYLDHPNAIKQKILNNPVISKIFYKSNRIAIEKYYKNGNLIFMDDLNVIGTQKDWNLDFNDIDQHIIRLPYDIYNFDPNIIENRINKGKETYNILTVARADFPFKGYIKGLIETCAMLSSSYHNIKLKIVTNSSGKDIIKEWKKQAESEYSTIINMDLYFDLDQQELNGLYNSANLYLGMGTTILEAAEKAVIAIPVRSYTYELSTLGFFSDNLCLGSLGDSYPLYSGNTINDITNVLDMTEDEYREKSIECRDTLIKNFSLEAFYKSFMNHINEVPENHYISRSLLVQVWLFLIRREFK